MSKYRIARSQRCWGLAAIGAIVIGGTSASRAADDPPEIAANVIEFLTYVRNNDGVVYCGLYDKKGWLKNALMPAKARIANGRALCVFRNVVPGTYGISAIHDENNNGKLDTNFIGMPTEDYCASRNARGFMGPPTFNDAKFVYKGKLLRLTVSMK